MRLKYVKLSGFKSFVDTTKVSVPNNLIGIVGPNGCGKSNVIDAIRWVMGESSAKTLRGDNMEDVIFNGSAARKPVNRAYVELVFDNTDGRAPGSYAKYGEIAIRRELVREGPSKYFINKTRCRRKDIQDIFLGTGLGPRSYSIIEQGMVGRIVESKPEDLRVLIEEAAGISKYKERRRETENRIRHTRDNLSRVEDITAELETQLRRLKRQANEAERFKTLKQKQRELDRQRQTLRWATLQHKVQQQDVELERLQTEFEAHMAEQRDVETQLEAMRQQQHELTEVLNKAQADYYSIGGEVAALEQSIEHARQTRQQLQDEYQRLQESEAEASQHLTLDQRRLKETEAQLQPIKPVVEQLSQDYAAVNEVFQAADSAFQHWQTEWEILNRDAANPEKEREVQSARIEQYRQQIEHFNDRAEQVNRSLEDIALKLQGDDAGALQARVEEADQNATQLEQNLTELERQLASQRRELEETREQYNQVRHDLQDDIAELKSLQTLQAAALGEDNDQVKQWLDNYGLQNATRLAEQLQAEPGWEKAVDLVLDKVLNAMMVQKLDDFSAAMFELSAGRIALVDHSSAPLLDGQQFDITVPKPGTNSVALELMVSKVNANGLMIDGWFHSIYAADSLAKAMQARNQLAAHESIVTRDGNWIGPNWASFGQHQSAESGILQREAEIERLTERQEAAQQQLQKIQYRGEQMQEHIVQLDQQREQFAADLRETSPQRTELHNELSAIQARSGELLKQQAGLQSEQQRLSEQLESAHQEVETAQRRLADAEVQASIVGDRRVALSEQKTELFSALESARQEERQARDEHQARQLELERLLSSQQSLTESVERLSRQLEKQSERRAELAAIIATDEDPTAELRSQLQGVLEQRLQAEKDLSKARDELNDFENQMQSTDQQRLGYDHKSQAVRDGLEKVRMSRQEILVRRDTIAERLEKTQQEMQILQQELPEDLALESLESELADTEQKIERIGAVNLVAIDEFEQCSERKSYLDQQHADLMEATATLEAAIAKIDKETRARFKETFDNLNIGFKQFFPRMFGGGSAYLELTGNDLLSTGVAVMARPPGKRNSTIHLLSGGEKALAAVSLLFAFFDLNPAPFCVLDEVDAPLDDANVERYANVLKQLGEKTQLLFITHNKITMEVSDVLIGVTMAEPGVSRLVAVDVAEAAAMAAS